MDDYKYAHDTKYIISSDGQFLIASSIEKLKLAPKFDGNVAGIGPRMLALIACNGKEYFADHITGQLYCPEGLHCLSSDRLRLSEIPVPSRKTFEKKGGRDGSGTRSWRQNMGGV